ncbi:MAG: NUDIX domain-containing protein [Lysobacteraceae bacterium]|nr:MAG: NUDIX domain-containing protein [Xanthomonadaceae bacterium]
MTAAIHKVALLCVRDRRVLLARSRGRNAWYLPGGKREAGESDEAALLREVHEELAVTIVPGSLVDAGVFTAQADGQPDGTLVRSRCWFVDIEGGPVPSAEIEELAWMRQRDHAQCSSTTRLVLDRLRADGLID